MNIFASIVLLNIAQVSGPKSDHWTLAVGGDVMFNQIPVESKSLVELESTLKNSTVSILNLEIPLTNASTVTPRKSLEDRRAKRQFVLKANPEHVSKFVSGGVDLVSLGNNHAMDFGVQGLLQEQKLLSSSGIRFTGAGQNVYEAERPAEFRLPNGALFRLASFLSFMADSANEICTPATKISAGVAALKFQGVVGKDARNRIGTIVSKLKKGGSFAAVAIHWGIERQTVPTPYQVSLARAFIDAGADLVIGHHPHVLQGAEYYKGKPIFYSLGNLISPLPSNSALFQVDFNRSVPVSVKMVPFRISGGKCRVLTSRALVAETARFEKLCYQVSLRYPSEASKQLKVGIAE
jgi:poly-gamma-glutamate synthesis protein (capsule biosynthesis protein)